MTEIAVVVPAHIPTGAHITWLGECLNSLFAQTFTDWELALVFDGCTNLDLTSLNIDRLDGKVKVLAFEEQRGPGFARNAGVRVTSAPWLVFLDADDRLKADALEHLYGARDETKAVYGDLDWIGEREGHERLVDFDERYLREFSGPQPITTLHARQAWRIVDGFAEHLSGLEDLEYWIRLAEQGIFGKRIETTVLEYRQHQGSRQKQLETSGRIGDVMREIRERHRLFFNGGQTMPCSTCPGGQPGGNPATPPQPEGTVALRYQGARQGSFQTPPLPSGTRYLVDGIGAFVYATPGDVQHLLLYMERGGPMFAVVEQSKPVEPVPVIQPQLLFSKLTPQKAVEDITSLSIKQATPVVAGQSDVMDLKIMRAMEKAGTNRSTVLKLIDNRMREIQGE